MSVNEITWRYPVLLHFYIFLDKLRREERGASLVEYGLLVALIALAVIVSLRNTGTNLNSLFSKVASNLTT
jgi:pilus assembly protein Flp/PilA